MRPRPAEVGRSISITLLSRGGIVTALAIAGVEAPFEATLMAGEVVLTWTAAEVGAWTPAPAVTYTVTREAGSAMETVAAGLRGARYVDTAVQPGGAYTYQVAAAVDGGRRRAARG